MVFADVHDDILIESVDTIDTPEGSDASSEAGFSDSEPVSPASTTGTSVASFPREQYHRPAYLDPANFREGPLSDVPTTRLRQMLARDGIVVAPGICDGLSARCAVEAGFDCLYQSGAATTASRLGMPDLGIATLNDFVEAAEMVCSLDTKTPVIADADTGFGGTAMVARTVQKYARAGVAALHIEDQVQTKRCGHLLGKQIVSTDEFLMRVRAAVQARDALPGESHFVIIARTDCEQVLGMEQAIYRLMLAKEAGADVCFIEGVKSTEALERCVQALAPTPVLVNVISGGVTPPLTRDEAHKAGAKIIIFSLASVVPMVHALREAFASLKKTGNDHAAAKGMAPIDLFNVVGLPKVIAFDKQAGGGMYDTI